MSHNSLIAFAAGVTGPLLVLLPFRESATGDASMVIKGLVVAIPLGTAMWIMQARILHIWVSCHNTTNVE